MRDLYATPRHSAPQMRFYEIAACARQARSSSPGAARRGGTSESTSRNKPLRTQERERNRRSNRRIRRLRSERICTTRWRAGRFSPRRFSHAIETNVLKCTHGRARVWRFSASVRAYMYARIPALAEMEDSVVRRYPGGISHREISISAFLSTIPRSRTDYPLIRAGQRREVE